MFLWSFSGSRLCLHHCLVKVVPDVRTFHHNLSEAVVLLHRNRFCGVLHLSNLCLWSLSGHQSQITTIQTEVSSSKSSTEKSLQLKISELLAMLEQRQTTITKQEEVCHMTSSHDAP